MPPFFWFSLSILCALMMIFMIVAWRISRHQKNRELSLRNAELREPPPSFKLYGDVAHLEEIVSAQQATIGEHTTRLDKLANSIPKGTETQFHLCQAQIDWLYGQMIDRIPAISIMPKRGEFLQRLHREGVITLTPPVPPVPGTILGPPPDRSKDNLCPGCGVAQGIMRRPGCPQILDHAQMGFSDAPACSVDGCRETNVKSWAGKFYCDAHMHNYQTGKL